MKTLPILLIFVMFFGTFFIANSYSAVAPREDPSLPQINLHLVLRNSEGHLVSYIETDFVYIKNLYLTHQYLNAIDDKTTFVEEGITYERFQWQKTEYFNSQKQITAYGLMSEGIAILLMMHEPYISQPGDSVTVYWDIIRTVT